MKQAQQDFEELHNLSRHARTLRGIEDLLHWDQETYMPKNAAGIRAVQLKTLAGLIHTERTGQKFKTALSKLIDMNTGNILQSGLSQPQVAALREWHREYRRDKALPRTFVEEFAALSSQSIHVWAQAKKNNDFHSWLPFLEKMIHMCRKKADKIGYTDHPYDALMDEFEPHMTVKAIKPIFDSMQRTTTGLLKKIQSAKQVDDKILHDPYSKSKQITFNKTLLRILGYSPENGRLDLSTHPFSLAPHPTDSRITTRIYSQLPMSNLRSVLHECGHAFYEMGLPQEHYGSPLGEAVSLGIHESQSRWWEIYIGASHAFWSYCLPLLKHHYKESLQHVSVSHFWKAVNKVEPSFIRVEADEVTYGLHILLRFELEIALIEGTLKPKEIPEAWDGKMKELLGIVPPTHAKGCLQDIHWSWGAFGYFPTYALGNLFAAHFFQAFEKKHPDWEKKISKGDFAFIKTWLHENIFQYGKRYTAMEILKKVNGKAFSAEAFDLYLNKKYTDVYAFTR